MTAGATCKRTLFLKNSKEQKLFVQVKFQRCCFRVEGAVSSQEEVVLKERAQM